jgi:hypothetical protein
MLKRAIEVSGTEDEGTTEESPEAITTLAVLEESEVEEVTDSVDSTPTLLGLGSFLSCFGADDTSSETVAGTAGTVESAEVAEVDLDVLTI